MCEVVLVGIVALPLHPPRGWATTLLILVKRTGSGSLPGIEVDILGIGAGR